MTCMAITNKIGEIVHSMVMRTWRSIQLVLNVVVENRNEKPEKYVFSMPEISLGT